MQVQSPQEKNSDSLRASFINITPTYIIIIIIIIKIIKNIFFRVTEESEKPSLFFECLPADIDFMHSWLAEITFKR